jgi:DNA replication and repair protein RecF
MYIESLNLLHFRNYSEQHVEFSRSVNVFYGENAQGKTNALEAIYFLAMGKSHRASRDVDCIQWGQDNAQIQANVVVRNRRHDLKIQFRNGAKRAAVNGVNQGRMTDFVGHFQVVLFAPEDLQLVKGGPGGRRRFIDMELGQTHPTYLYHLTNYQKVLQQRNTLLKQGKFDEDFIQVLDQQLAEHGSEVLLRRFQFLRDMEPLSAAIYATISDGREQFSFRYQCSIPALADTPNPQREWVVQQFLDALAKKRNADLHAGHTTVGPHRDDLVFFLNEQPVQSFASQGQQRTIALALRLAEIDFIHQEIGEYPVLLLDDVLSELDDVRQKNLVLNMSEKVQTIVTTTTISQLRDKLHADARLFEVRSGIIQK